MAFVDWLWMEYVPEYLLECCPCWGILEVEQTLGRRWNVRYTECSLVPRISKDLFHKTFDQRENTMRNLGQK
jgi:hypothetical protein